MLETNVKLITESIAQACGESKRPPESVNLIAVTKSVTADKAAGLLRYGINKFAENRVDSLLEKQSYFQTESIEWHLIGTLQRRKVKDVINKIDYFHALDNFKLAAEIQKRATKPVNCFVQVNVSKEESKHGLLLEDTIDFVKSLSEFDNINIVGLMTMAPYQADVGFIQDCFDTLAEKQKEIANLKIKNAPCTELSMGMSQDFAQAIQAGATYVRIGSAFFKDKESEG
ncbi:YggS family pyridoxal phosphate-dependent enzyme [Vagococcus coleopterorum]|uniref:Pyridoxal phosphate homeostasis protein n=1 Tax=Vagococcus coleopterorum TaxID=2714946 RepID=A0A6G8APP7_9ENTE|nr:YggS family pyridoxal phosphate-dependent enzyme [Vagococcus coleopterorum]QIL46950.1 YggS family pyridoxal phosphate-dependent enzyme [Vagococcus coleopterorum]